MVDLHKNLQTPEACNRMLYATKTTVHVRTYIDLHVATCTVHVHVDLHVLYMYMLIYM